MLPRPPSNPSTTQPSGRTLAIGDIHGCLAAFETVITALKLSPHDTLVVLGDVIDRGPHSQGVIQRLLTLQDQCRLITILGNHEQMLLDVVDGRMPRQHWLGFGGEQTLDSYGEQASLAAIPEEHLAFLRTWGDFHEQEEHFFAHGNYLEFLPLHKQPWEKLRWQSLNQRTPGPHQSGKTAIVGHTANKHARILELAHLICIDTHCYGGGWLTALETNTGRLWQANEQQELRCDSLA